MVPPGDCTWLVTRWGSSRCSWRGAKAGGTSPGPRERWSRCPACRAQIDAVALSEWMCGWYPAVEDTAYREVKRVPPATVTTFDRGEVVQRRYWDPSPITEPIAWSREEDLEAFEGLLTRAVTRAVGGERRARDIPQRRGRFDHGRGGGNRHHAGGGARAAPGAVTGLSGRRQQRGGHPDRRGAAARVAAAAGPLDEASGPRGCWPPRWS